MLRLLAGACRHRLDGRPRPLNVMVAVTDRCTQACSYCAISARRTPDPSTRDLLRLLDQMARAGTRRVGLWGGEPLLRDDIGTILQHCAALGFWTSVVTNGARVLQRLGALRHVQRLIVSYDGAAHEAVRGAPAQVLEALRLAQREGIARSTLTVITRDNVDLLSQVLDVAEEFSAWAHFQVLHHPEGLAGNGAAALAPEDPRTRAALRRLLMAKQEGRRVGNTTQGLRQLIGWGDYRKTRSPLPGAVPCLAGVLYCNVDTDGSTYPCTLATGEVPGRNAYAHGFSDAFLHVHKDTTCRSCVATAFTEYNFLFGLEPSVALDWVGMLLPIRLSGPRRGRGRSFARDVRVGA
jgi:MoaA/NifB/PqqE/SkfB family radical SAM enzyme